MEDALKFRDLIDTISTPKEENHLHLVLHTFGGDPYTAAKIVNLFHHNFSKVTVVIPYVAMSAGTLLALGADEIIISDMGQIGPLDMQVSHPDNEKAISALDYTESVSYTFGQAKEAFSLFLREIQEVSGRNLRKKDAYDMASKRAIELFVPMIDKIDPVHLNKCSRILTVAKKYGQEFLKNYSLKRAVLEEKGDDYCNSLIGYLTYRMPDHAYGIFYSEANKIGLNVFKQDSYTHWDKVWGKIKPAMGDFFQEKPVLSKLILELKFDATT